MCNPVSYSAADYVLKLDVLRRTRLAEPGQVSRFNW
jgi:hypothetical protein